MAFDINATLGPLIDGLVTVMPSLLALVVAIVPVVIVIAFNKFIIGFLESIIQMIKF